MDDIDAMFSEMLGEMDLLTQVSPSRKYQHIPQNKTNPKGKYMTTVHPSAMGSYTSDVILSMYTRQVSNKRTLNRKAGYLEPSL